MAKRWRNLGVALTLPVLVIVVAAAVSGAPAKRFSARLTGYQEVPAVSTTGFGSFRVKVLANGSLAYVLNYSSLVGVSQAHIHFGQPGVNGAISVFLCTNLGNGPAGTQPCPAPPASLAGTIDSGDVIGPSAQGIEAGEFDELVRAIRAGATYANVHTSGFPGGEIRGRLIAVS